MAEHRLQCEVVSPERIVYSSEAEMVVVRGVDGELGIMAQHIPIVTPLAIGEMRIKHEGGQEILDVHGGYLEFSNNTVTVLADAAELREEIDVERAKLKKAEREKQMGGADKLNEQVLIEAEVSLRKALLRLRLSGVSRD
jgi:F-type H+-transporting ATPase subunit epsilon